MDAANDWARKSSTLLEELSSRSFKISKEHSFGPTIPVFPMTQWSSDQNEPRLGSEEPAKHNHFEHPSWGSSIRQVEQQPATMSIQFGTQQHQHHHSHSHSHLHYYAPADVQLRNETSSQEFSQYRNCQDQYYSNPPHPQPTDSFSYQTSLINTNYDSNYSVSVQQISTSSNECQSSAIYGHKNGTYCQQHRTYLPNSVTNNPVPQETSLSLNYPYPNHLNQQQQVYGPTSNNMEPLQNQSKSQASIAMDLELTNNVAHTRSLDHYGNYDNTSSTGYRDYYARQYNSSSTYQYPAQERYMQIISNSRPTGVDQYETEQRQHFGTRACESSINSGESRSTGGLVLIPKSEREQAPGLKKKVREGGSARRRGKVDKPTKSSSHSSGSNELPGDSKQSSKTNQCHICNRHYARPSTLKTHLRTHTNERPYKCSVCCKTFSQAANLTAHQRVHTGERPFPCPICGRQFSQSSSVITHLRTHSGERPYRCKMCDRTFSDSSTLTKHCRIHSGEKPYQCEYCQLNFSQSGNLSRHIRLHLLNGLRNPSRVPTPAGDTLLQARQQQATFTSSNVSIPASFSSSSSNSSSTSTASY